jgi:orotate phosphoribosyltransferase
MNISELVPARRGHFRLESGYHGALWLDLDAVFRDPGRIAPHVTALAERLTGHRAEAVCGPLVGGALLAQRLATEIGAQFWYTERTPSDGDIDDLFQADYRLPAALQTHASGKRVILVDDVMSAGSSLRATFKEVRRHGADVVVAAALLVLGHRGEEFFHERDIPVVSLATDEYQTWRPDECPMCLERIPLERP